MLNLVGAVERYGKEIRGDLYEGKRTLMLARLSGLADADERARLGRFLALPRGARSEAEAGWVFDAMERRGCIGFRPRCLAPAGRRSPRGAARGLCRSLGR